MMQRRLCGGNRHTKRVNSERQGREDKEQEKHRSNGKREIVRELNGCE